MNLEKKEEETDRSTSFFRLPSFLTRSILLMTLTKGTSRPIMQLMADKTPEKYFAVSSMNCDSRR